MDDEVREIWRQEIRQRHRLAGFPGAREYIVGLLDSGEDSDGFYLALIPDQRLPLGAVRSQLPSHHFLQQPRGERNRLLIWRNLRRVAVGLSILHTQGLLHRNLDEWAIYTDAGEAPDFQLSGFEWSIRLAGVAGKPGGSKRAMAATAVVYSFLQDWHAFGLIAAALLGVDSAAFTSTRRREGGGDTTLHLMGAERELLQRLLRADPMDRIDGELVEQKILAIVNGLETVVGKRESHLILTCALNSGSLLTTAIREASGRTIEADDLNAQLAFIKEDLIDEPLLLFLKSFPNAPETQKLVLAGSRLTYRLQAFQAWQRRGGATPSWAVAYCASIMPGRPAASAIVRQVNLADRGIQVMSLEEANRRFAVIQGRAPHWDQLGEDPSEQTPIGSKQYRALVLLQVLEALTIAADIWPVEIRDTIPADGRIKLVLRSRSDEERERLSKVLALGAPAARMRDAFAADTPAADEDWVLTDIGVLGERETETARWRLVDIVEQPGEVPLYEFDGEGPVPLGDRLFLRQADHAGEDKLLRRRIRALRALREHVELLEMLDDPRLGVRRTHEVPQEDEHYGSLDASKQEALRAIWAVMPLFLLQGPPGVGKTRLVRELVGRRIREDGSSRILLTAQSHHAVDHLLEEVSKELSGLTPEPIVVRSRSKDRDVASDRYDVRQQAGRLITQFSSSALVAEAPAELRAKASALAHAFSRLDEAETQEQKGTADRSIEALLLRSAHLVFASTNAGDLERLGEEKAQFDWTIIEEAGKATGTELIAPLLLSHRRVMIGDHQQLPPFNADRLKSLLANPARIGEALEVGGSLVGRPFREAGMDDVIDDPSEDLTEVCGEAAAALMMFETLVEGELARAAKNRSPSSLTIAQRLNRQHRMHPAIARLVSASFYNNDLQTDEVAARRFASTAAPFESIDLRRLPPSPIVVVDMPFVQREINAKHYELPPRFHNPREVDAVLEVLSLLRPSSSARDAPSLAVLAPYREQVKRLRLRIAGQRQNMLKHLSGFTFEGEADTPTGTVDSFQGSEADVVVISLVRNNHHSGLRGLGFLADARRMNVLLSRAKWKLVLVVSLDFLHSRAAVPLQGTQSVDFLKRMLDTLTKLRSERGDDGMPLASVVTFRALIGRSR